MSGSSIRAFGPMLVALCSFAAVAVAQTRGDAAVPAASPATFPAWAYPWDPNVKAPPGDDVLHRMPGSTAAFSFKQARDLFFSPDWHPDDHPTMPEVVERGRRPDVRACGSCHRAEGTGGPENSSLAGLPAAYIVQQMADYKSGARKFSGPPRGPTLLMIAAAKAATDAEVQAAANYFAPLKLKPIIKVVETDTVPKTYLARNHFVISESGGEEPIGQRIVEVPVNVDQFELRDSRSQFIAYVPVGSVAKGEALAKTGGAGTTVPCAVCHGPDLKGVGPIPGIAGRSPSYAVRQLYDFKHGARAGIGSAMKPELVYPAQPDQGARLLFFSHTAVGSDYRVSVRFASGAYTYRVYSNSGQGNAGVLVMDTQGKVLSNVRCIERPHMFPSYMQRALACDTENPHGASACGDKPLRLQK